MPRDLGSRMHFPRRTTLRPPAAVLRRDFFSFLQEQLRLRPHASFDFFLLHRFRVARRTASFLGLLFFLGELHFLAMVLKRVGMERVGGIVDGQLPLGFVCCYFPP